MGAACSAQDQVTAPSKITVYYFGPHTDPGTLNIYGRAIGIYLTLDQAGFPYDMKPPSALPGGCVAIGGENPASYALPVVDIDGTLMAQAPQILSVLGNFFGLAGKTTVEKMQVEHALGDVNDLFGVHGKFAEDEALKKKWFGYFEKKLAGKSWMGGTAEPSIADFHGVFSMVWIDSKRINYRDYPNFNQWWTNIKNYPVVAKMLASCVNGRTMIPGPYPPPPMPEITVYYHGPHTPGMNTYGRAMGIYLALDQAECPYEMKPPSQLPAGFVSMGKADGGAYAPPAVDIDGTCMAQTPMILSVLGEMFDLGGKTPAEKMSVRQALGDMNDVLGVCGKFSEDEELKKKWFGYMEKTLLSRSKTDKAWMGGTAEPSVADFHGLCGFCFIDQAKIDYSAYPKVTKWCADIKAVPVVAKMIASCVDGRTMVP